MQDAIEEISKNGERRLCALKESTIRIEKGITQGSEVCVRSCEKCYGRKILRRSNWYLKCYLKRSFNLIGRRQRINGFSMSCIALWDSVGNKAKFRCWRSMPHPWHRASRQRRNQKSNWEIKSAEFLRDEQEFKKTKPKPITPISAFLLITQEFRLDG